MSRNIRLIALDLDGTALLDDHKTITPRLLSALDVAHRNGVAVAVVTGRQFGMLPDSLSGTFPWKHWGACCNGGQIWDLSKKICIDRMVIPLEECKALLKLARQWNTSIEFSTDSILNFSLQDLEAQYGIPQLKFHRETILKQHGQLHEDLSFWLEQDSLTVEKVNFPWIRPEIRGQVHEALSPMELSAVWATSSCIEVTPAGATKDRGLRQICNLLHISTEETMALGDSGNDLPMLTQAGLGVAMGNAPDYVKMVAHAVTASNEEDGAAIAVETYVLGNEFASR